MTRRAALALLPLLALTLSACGGGSSSSGGESNAQAAAASSSRISEAMGSNTDAGTSSPSAGCTTTDDLVVYTTFTDGEQSMVQKMGGCGRMGDTVAFLKQTVSPGTCQHVAPAADNPDLTGNETGVTVTLNNETATFGDAC